MQVEPVQKLISIIKQSFNELGVSVTLEKLEDLAGMIHHAMTAQARHYHTLKHVFTLVDPNNAIQSLAALYHDIVYYPVDLGFSQPIWELISPFIRQEEDNIIVAENVTREVRPIYLMLDVFGVFPGQKILDETALNEFLSALVMTRQLDGLVSEKDLLRIAVCIEATIPFRGLDEQGRSHFDLMELRLAEIVQRYGLEFPDKELIEIVNSAVSFANKDIKNFAENDPGLFLENTWKLLPEKNTALRLPDLYSIGNYRQALVNMEGFLKNLNTNTIFNRYRGVPSMEEYSRMVHLAQENIQVASNYLAIKILSIAILEALAKATGGDAPLSLFLGDRLSEGSNINRLEYFLPELVEPAWADPNSSIYRLLEAGRVSETSFDVKNSPLVLFVYKTISPEKIAVLSQRARDFFSGALSPVDFLSEINPVAMQSIARACSLMVHTRRELLLQFAGNN